MSIRQRLEDARALAMAGSDAGAFIQVLIAAAATARKRYPPPKYSDGDSFKNFIYDEMGVITEAAKYEVALPYLGKNTPLEDILYKHLRCQLLHEGEMPETVIFTESVKHDGLITHQLLLGTPLGFPKGWIENLATAIWISPENDELWTDQVEKRALTRKELGELVWDGSYCRRPKPTK